jgi:hypothetical protein
MQTEPQAGVREVAAQVEVTELIFPGSFLTDSTAAACVATGGTFDFGSLMTLCMLFCGLRVSASFAFGGLTLFSFSATSAADDDTNSYENPGFATNAMAPVSVVALALVQAARGVFCPDFSLPAKTDRVAGQPCMLPTLPYTGFTAVLSPSLSKQKFDIFQFAKNKFI